MRTCSTVPGAIEPGCWDVKFTNAGGHLRDAGRLRQRTVVAERVAADNTPNTFEWARSVLRERVRVSVRSAAETRQKGKPLERRARRRAGQGRQ